MRSPLSQAKTPLLDALREYAHRDHAPFYTPGHKRGQGISPPLADLLGTAVFRADLSELPQLDNLFAPEGVILEAQHLAAQAFGADQTWFLVNGSTSGIIAAILATCGNGDKIILPRNIHSSAIAGLILSGAMPIFISPEYDPILDITHSITPMRVKAALDKHPDAKAVMMVYPTYYGVCGNLEAIADLTHSHGIPLLVDEAHGAHFAFHPDLPPSALSLGADLTVQSTHKVLGAMTQASMLHIQGDRLDPQRLSKALQLVQTTSPSYILMASLDAARSQMALQGDRLMTQTLHLAAQARTEISQIPHLTVFQPQLTAGCVNFDPTRLTVTVSDLKISGFDADDRVHELGVTSEFASLQHLTFIISLGNTQTDIKALIEALTTLAQEKGNLDNPRLEVFSKWKSELLQVHPSSFTLQPTISPREAFFAPTETLPIGETSDRLCAEIVCPYPPGIPALMPGEMINPAAIDYLHQTLALGGSITGCSDPTLQTLRVVQ